MDVEFLSEIFLSHHGAFEMPSGKSFAPGAWPVHYVFGFSLFPKGEIVRSPLVTLAVQRPGSFQGVVKVTARKHTIMMLFIVFLNVEIHGTVRDVGVARLEDLLDGLYLFDDVAGCPGFD